MIGQNNACILCRRGSSIYSVTYTGKERTVCSHGLLLHTQTLPWCLLFQMCEFLFYLGHLSWLKSPFQNVNTKVYFKCQQTRSTCRMMKALRRLKPSVSRSKLVCVCVLVNPPVQVQTLILHSITTCLQKDQSVIGRKLTLKMITYDITTLVKDYRLTIPQQQK